MIARLPLYPPASMVGDAGHLVIGGCDTTELAAEFGTPLYLFDEASLRARCREFRNEFGGRYPDVSVAYACKAFINTYLLSLVAGEGLGLYVVSGGELGIAGTAGFPMDRVYFAGNNKSAREVQQALDARIRRLVVDNLQELDMLGQLAVGLDYVPEILLRLTPGVDPHTHRYITTGNVDSKFGIPLAQAEQAVLRAMALRNVSLVGFHFHLGSLIHEVEPYRESIHHVLALAAEMQQRHGFRLRELDVGGGFAIQYTLDSPAPPVSAYAEAIISGIKEDCRALGLDLPRLVIEPGRSLVGRAGVALYTVGVIKDIPGIRRYVSVDGGMADNIRPALYGARHEAVLANRMLEPEAGLVTVAGKFCESGDVLIRDIGLPEVAPGDIMAVADCGAYCLPEAMNYNASFRPAVIMVNGGEARLIRRRETLEDLMRSDVTGAPAAGPPGSVS